MTTSMPQRHAADEGLDTRALWTYLRDLGLTAADVLDASLISGGKSNLTYRVTDGVSRWILRRPPLGHVEPGAHDVGREYRVMAGLASTAVPVPASRVICQDTAVIGAPFYLMDEVEGEVLRTRDQVESLSVEQRSAVADSLVDTLVALHEVDIAAAGLTALGRPDGFLERQLARWARQFAAVSSRDPGPAEAVVDALTRTMPTSAGAAVVHGDYRIDNVMVDALGAGSIVAVLDWEMATLGDPLADLGMLAMFWDEPGRPFNPITGGLTAFEGFGSVEQMVHRYSSQRGIDVDRLDWYLCFSEFKLAVILEQIDVRHASGQTVGDGFEGLTAMVDGLLDKAVDAAGRLR